MPLGRVVRSQLARVARARSGGSDSGQDPLRSLVNDYQVAGLLEVDGKVPVNYFTFSANFGDLLSPWLVSKMTGREVVVADRDKPHYVAIGSIISQGTDLSIFWGTGAYGTEAKREVPANARFTAVRGPLTQAKLSAAKGFGIPVPEVYGDPTLLVPLYYQPEVPVTDEYGVVVRWSERAWAEATYGPDVKLIDCSRGDVEGVIDDVLSCRRIVSSSLRALTLADAYGIPSAWLASSSPRGGVFQFYDYFASVNKFRQPQKLDLADRPVTVDLLAELSFTDEPITFDHRCLLDAAPFLRRKGAHRAGPSSIPTREPGDSLRNKDGTAVLVPSLGYFGGIAANYFSVKVPRPVSRLRLFLTEAEAQLDLRGLEMYRNGRRVGVDESNISTAQSSDARRPGARRSPFAFGGIRTEKQTAPWWAVTFDPPVDADEVRIYNRLDGWGVRASSLTVAAAGPDGYFETIRSVDSDRAVEATLDLLHRITGRDLDLSVLASQSEAIRLREELLADLAERTLSGLLTADREEQRLLSSLIPRRRLPEGQSLSDDEWTLLGHLLAAERARVPSSKTSMAAFHRVLDSRAKLRRLESEVNRAGEVLGSPRAVLTRHGFTDIGILQQRADDYVGLILRATALLDECGYPAMIAYGTLLGAVREGNFLAHDDDVDMLIPIPAANRDEVEKVLAPLAEQLRSKGWRVSRPNSYTNFHLGEPETGLHVDVFPLLVDGERSSLHMEKMRLRDIATDVVLPPKPFTFLGREVLVPADPEAFLADRYGDGWSTPDPFYDWPWALHD
ncbi:LicD family protein [Microlunatus sp. Gsoil 973]|uniref:LicD family protein n=1 Tax=Microlunatus sp. Gsoil 973 TaxID=2672569 RepID=UPI0012B4D9A1|nr:LicD family protein [Microlunatus sp. Gsoil 973]QGN32942.1 hypothetical protein GJV80_09105 [Microlunatus sp. Gsoil 973]